MADVFEEVEEQLRSDRYKALALKLLPWLAGLLAIALVAALGVWGWREYHSNAAEKASEQYAQSLEAFSAGRRPQAVNLWTEIAKSRSRAYKSLALMQLGGEELSQNRTAQAVAKFDEAAEAAPDPILGDVARLKSAFALMDTAPYKDVEARLKPLMEEGRPYREQAREALAFAKMMAGDLAGARGEFAVISLSSDVPQDMRDRAQAAMGVIDSGAAKSLPAIVKAAAALPPAPAVPEGLALPQQPQAPGPQ